MSMDVDEAFEAAQRIIADARDRIDAIISEEDAKIQLIQRFVVEALGWNISDIGAEVRHENGYSDYILSDDGSWSILLEAKRLGTLDVRSSDRSHLRHLKLSGSALANCVEGVDQAAAYAGPNGLRMAVLTDGRTWIVFRPYVEGSNFK